MILLGIDPGTATTGWGVVELNKKNIISALDFGKIGTSKDDLMPERLFQIYNSICHLIEKHKPDALVIEALFFSSNVKTAIAVGQSRGIYVMAGGKYSIPVFEYTALEAKMALTGYGRADKKDVRAKVKEVLELKRDIKPIDASDALALTICHVVKHDLYDFNKQLNS